MNQSTSQKYVDHPAPSIGLISLFLGLICFLIVLIPLTIFEIPGEEIGVSSIVGVCGIFALSIAVLTFYLWPLYTTYYTIDASGITVKYGPWTHISRWEDFATVYLQKGLFITKIGWPSINPCVRLSNGLVLSRKKRKWGLYITPNHPEAFIKKIEQFAPELTKEVIL